MKGAFIGSLDKVRIMDDFVGDGPIPERDFDRRFTLEEVNSLWFDGDGAMPDAGMTLKPRTASVSTGNDTGFSEQPLRDSLRMTLSGFNVTLHPNRVTMTGGNETGSDSVEPRDYELGGNIGRGGMGLVIAARQASLDRRVAIKMILPKREDETDARSRFVTEALTTGALDHPCVVPVYELGQDEAGRLFYSMKEVRGSNWRTLMPNRSEKENIETLCQIANAVASAHSKGVLHRDIKSENVMIGDFGEIMLMDWGLAVGMGTGAKAPPLTPENALGGTPAYMAPEMARGAAAEIGPWSDQYLLGAVLFEILTGKAPHGGESARDCLQNAANGVIIPVARRDEWMEVAYRAMQIDPVKRYPSVKAFLAAVRNCQAHGESLELSKLAAEWAVQAAEKKDYNEYARTVMGYEQALELWKGNVAARRGVDEARLQYAALALGNGDYDLALSLLDRIEGEKAADLAGKAAAAKRERDNRRRMVRLLGSAAVILLAVAAVVAGGAAVIISRQAEAERLAREEAVRQTILAESRREEADRERLRAEGALVETERQRSLAEEQKNLAESRREEADRERLRAEGALVETERQRSLAEEQKNLAESRREEADRERLRAEGALVETERQRSLAEEQKNLAESRREEAELERSRAEDALVETERQRRIAERRRAETEEAKEAEAMAQAARLVEQEAKLAAEVLARQAAEEALAARDVVRRMGYLEDTSRWQMDEENARERQTQTARKHGTATELLVTLPDGAPLAFSLIPGGEFVMGSPPREPRRSSEEHLHEVELTTPYYIARSEITRGQWRALVGIENAATLSVRPTETEAVAWRFAPLPPGTEDLPATGVSHGDVVDLLLPALAGALPQGLVARLPSEAEWEWAARAGSGTAFPGGDGPEYLERDGWFEGNSDGMLHPVMRKLPNAWGLFDASGNAAEMVADAYDPTFYLSAERLNPLCRIDSAMRVSRGGSYLSMLRHCRLAARSYVHRENRHPQVGVRLAASGPEAAITD